MEDSGGLGHQENLDSIEPHSAKKPFKTFSNMFEKLAPSLESSFRQKGHKWTLLILPSHGEISCVLYFPLLAARTVE